MEAVNQQVAGENAEEAKAPVRVPLIADPDERFLQRLVNESAGGEHTPYVAANRRDFANRLGEDPSRFSGVFLNPKLCDTNGVTLVRAVREHCPTTPIFLLLDGPSPFPANDAARLTIRDSFRKPVTLSELTRAIDGALTPFDKDEVLGLKTANESDVGVEFDHGDENFVAIRAKGFLAGQICFFDVYVRINEKRYVKILVAGDAFSRERLDTYLKKGVEKLYLRKQVQDVYLKYCDALANAMVENSRVPSSIRVEQVANWGEETAKFLSRGGLNEGAVNYARSYTRKVNKLVKDLGLERFEAVRAHLLGAENMEHSVATMMMASLLAIPLHFDGERSATIVGLAALLHDVALGGDVDKFHPNCKVLYSPEEKKLLDAHPLAGREMLANIPGIEPVVLQAVAQHHERRTGRGYPSGLGPGSISVVSEIIGVSEEIVKQMSRVAENPALKLQDEIERHCFNEFSITIVSSLKTFLKG